MVNNKKNTNYIPLTVNEIIKKIKKNRNIKITSSDLSYIKYNKGYKKLDFTKQYFTANELNCALNDEYYKTWKIILRQNELPYIKTTPSVSDRLYLKNGVEHLCLLKEIGSQLEQVFFNKGRDTKGNNVYSDVNTYRPFRFNSSYRGDIYLFSYPKRLEWKAELLRDFLHKKEFLFDDESPHWKGMKKLRYFCLKNLMNTRVESWEYQIQRFLAKKD